jgi:hypothetical protein
MILLSWFKHLKILLLILAIAPLTSQSVPATAPVEVFKPQEVRPLSGKLNTIPVFNSNSPELVLKEGLLLSTFPSTGKTYPQAHLNFPFRGYFDIFAHHVAKATEPNDKRTLYLGILINNPGDRDRVISILQGASYLSQPDALFIDLPSMVTNPDGLVYAGPGNRVMSDVLRGRLQKIFPKKLIIPGRANRMLLNLPIPVGNLDPRINGRSSYFRLHVNGTVYVASLAMFAPLDKNGKERQPTLEEWTELLERADLSTPRDRTPTVPGIGEKIVYGRVGGVSGGSEWKATLTDSADTNNLTIPASGESFSYGLSTLNGGRLGTGQIQSANMLVRYPDTAYQAHGNYGLEYALTLPLYNPTAETQQVSLTVQTPIKQDVIEGGLRFLNPPDRATFFRGTVKFTYTDDKGIVKKEYFHLVQKRGQLGEPLIKLTILPKQRRVVKFNFLYPPDATPPQVLTVSSIDDEN